MIDGKKVPIFLQKKKQKTSYLLGALLLAVPTPTFGKSFLVLYFKKEPLASFSKPLLASP